MTPEMEKVIKGLERCLICDISVIASEESQNAYRECEYTVGLYCEQKKLLQDAIALLKEQEDLGTELTNAVELIHKKNERIEKLLKEQKFLVDSDGKITPLPVVVRCKDCKNADYGTDEDGNRFMKCIGSVKCYGGTTPDWYCADGVNKDE